MKKPYGNVIKRAMSRKETIAFFGALIIFAAFSLASPNFLTVYNVMSILRQVSINAILAVGMTFVIISGGIDLSVSAIVSLSGTMAAISMANWNFGTFGGIIVGLTCGAAVGPLSQHSEPRLPQMVSHWS